MPVLALAILPTVKTADAVTVLTLVYLPSVNTADTVYAFKI